MKSHKFIVALLSATMILGTSITAYADSTYVVGAELSELFVNDSELSDGWHWVYDGTDSGGVICVYIQDGKRLRDTTTPDGYKVRYDGAWYTWDDGMPVTKVINYDYGFNRFPFSNTGELMENDYLGIKIKLTPDDFANGFDGWFGNWSGATNYRVFSAEFGEIRGVDNEFITVSIVPEAFGNSEYVSERVNLFHTEYLAGRSTMDMMPFDYTICGKAFHGTKTLSSVGSDDGSESYELFYPLPTGYCVRVNIDVRSEQGFPIGIDFLNTHMTIS